MPKATKKAKKTSKKLFKKQAKKSVKKFVKASKTKRLSKKELDIYKKLLMELRKKISGDLRQIEGDTLNTNQRDSSGDLSGYSFHMADMASDNYDRELNIGLASNEQQILNDIDVALKRIEEGTYGFCEITGEAIPKKRLLAMPYTRLSKKAQEDEEKTKRHP
ncbi:MAG TPA: TraR/DksA C4-type zinc finger protein [Candidatus Omnitrophota bacterium]|nr:TraR/DksA C4-type zinc finger protein [Candidatus Omnitrophota bacterium]